VERAKRRSTPITEMFEGMQATSISSRGNPPSVTMHPFLVVDIPLYDPSINTLDDAIDSLMAQEIISGYRPGGQGPPCDATKSEKFHFLPEILVFHLMRFQFTGSSEKLDKRVRYGARLRVKSSWLAPSNSRIGVLSTDWSLQSLIMVSR
jgi:ubiquitin C-terminal hydrolase